jgi:peptide chain release factor subunit 1
MHSGSVTDETLRSLSEVEADEPVVVSLFFDLDPAEFASAPARSSQITSLLSELDGLLRDGALSDDAAGELAFDRERIEALLRGDELDIGGAAGLAIYSSHALDVFEVVKLADHVDAAVYVEPRPILEPVIGLQDDGAWCVLLVTRDTARIFRGGPTHLREVRDLHSEVKNRHSAGGWSQARFERSVAQEVEWHLERATELLFRLFKRRPFEHLIIGANNEALRPTLTGQTHAYLAERIRGWVDIDEKHATDDEVLEAVRELMEAHLEQEQSALFERFAAQQGGGQGRAVEGLEPVLAALVERRVETLLVHEGATAPGTKCVTCGWLGPSDLERCLVDQTTLDPVENIVEPAIQAAIQQSAAVHVIRAQNDEDADGHAPAPFSEPLAALLRY